MISFNHRQNILQLAQPLVLLYTKRFYFNTANCLGVSASCGGCLQIKDDCLRVHPRSSTRAHRYAVCISWMPISTRSKFVGTRGRRGSRLLRGGALGCSGKVVPRWYMETSPADISRGGQGGIARARTAFCRLRIRFVAPLPSSYSIYVHIILTGNPNRPALISSTPQFAAEDGKWQ